ncbi:unnamed protein product [Peronospora belbahrii]|uniref:Uncharacterized protein n=1 Tax=Peronospora belbahrii TaxID=622444 RepID=A0ABN8CR60_9STRA|nr:unnamed protein product [Peronospora belbahrii]
MNSTVPHLGHVKLDFRSSVGSSETELGSLSGRKESYDSPTIEPTYIQANRYRLYFAWVATSDSTAQA